MTRPFSRPVNQPPRIEFLQFCYGAASRPLLVRGGRGNTGPTPHPWWAEISGDSNCSLLLDELKPALQDAVPNAQLARDATLLLASIRLPAAALAGRLPPELGAFPALESIYLAGRSRSHLGTHPA